MIIRSLLFRRGLWRTYLFSFIAVYLVCSIAIISSFYFLVEKLIKEEIAQSSLSMANQIRDVMDIRLDELYDLTVQIPMDKMVQSFFHVAQPFDVTSMTTIPEIIKMLAKYSSANSFITYFGIYYPSSDSVITPDGRYDTDYFFENVIHYENIGKDELNRIINDYHYRDIIPLQKISGGNKVNGNYVTYIQSVPIGEKEPSANIIMFIDERMLQSMMAKTMPPENGQVSVLTAEGQVVTAKGQDDSLRKQFMKHIQNTKKTFFEENNYLTVYSISNITDWYYAVKVNLRYAFQKVEKIRNITAIIALGSFIIGIIMSVLMAKFSYRPWKSLIEYIAGLSFKKTNYNDVDNEYQYVRNILKDILSEREKIQNNFEKNKDYARNYILQKLCEGEKISIEDLQNNRIEFPYEMFGVVMMKPRDEIGDIQHAFAQVIERIGSLWVGGCSLYTYYDQKEVLCIIINMTRDLSEESSFTTLISNIKTIVKEHIPAFIAMGIGGIYDSAELIPLSYQEGKKSLEYSFLYDSDCVVNYKQLSDITPYFPDLTLSFKKRLYDYVKDGNFAASSKLLDDFFSNLLNQKNISVSYMHYLYYNLMSIILQACNELNIKFEEVFHQGRERMLNTDYYRNIRQLISNIYNTYEKICEYIRESNEKETRGLSGKIEMYVAKHFKDKNLSLVEVAERFDICSSYLSRYMKKNLGMGFGDFVNKVRLEKAKYLLVENSRTINEIADEVGYASTHSFIRAFKRVEGITPGQYKDMLHFNSKELRNE